MTVRDKTELASFVADAPGAALSFYWASGVQPADPHRDP